MAEIGAILLLFSIGIELSLGRLSRVLNIAVLGALIQIILVTSVGYLVLRAIGISQASSLILAAGFSLSSTAVVVKILSDKGEEGTVHGEVMIGWLLVQDLAVIPMMVILPTLVGGSIWLPAAVALLKAGIVVAATVILGKVLAPALIHKVAALNSRELLVITAFAFALGTAALTSFFGISPVLGAFLAGVVISESQENHAIFAETRPLRDLFVALFFVTLGFLVSPTTIFSNFGLILALAALVLLVKILVVFFISVGFGYRGRVAVASAFGLSQVGEFSFIIFSSSLGLGLLTPSMASIGIATALVTLLITPFLFRSTIPFWRKARDATAKWPAVNKFFVGSEKKFFGGELSGHIIICGYGRVGSWVGRALETFSIPFVVIDYNQKVVNELAGRGVSVIYGDPTEPEVLEAASISGAKVVVLAIPDRVAQETLITHIQTVKPDIKIISRAHLDEDWEKLKTLKVDKIVQPEFEAAIAIVRTILSGMGKSKEEIGALTKSLRLSRVAKR